MTMLLVGASHHDAQLEQLSRLATAERVLASHLVEHGDEIAGAVVLSTCNRFEVYIDTSNVPGAVMQIIDALADITSTDRGDVADTLSVLVGPGVTQHLFSVAAGLESMVVGEREIAGQVRRALAIGQGERTLTPPLERLFQHALAASKTVASTTSLGSAGRTVVSVGIDLMEARRTLVGSRALVFGTGSLSRVVIAGLRDRGVADIAVYSATGRASEFAEAHDAMAIGTDQLGDALNQADVIVKASGRTNLAPGQLFHSRREQPRVAVLDLEIPWGSDDLRTARAVDFVVGLAEIRDAVPHEHSEAILRAQSVALAAADDHEAGESGRMADPAVVAMRAHLMSIVNAELERVRGAVDAESSDLIAQSLLRVSNEILHTPSQRARDMASSGDLETYENAMQTLFGIAVDVSPRPAL